MAWCTVNVLSISWAGEIAGKLAGKIPNVLVMYWVGMGQVLCPFSCNVLAVYPPGTLVLAPSVWHVHHCQLNHIETLELHIIHLQMIPHVPHVPLTGGKGVLPGRQIESF
jgi:hypothetical protein